MNHPQPIDRFVDRMIDLQSQRHSWLSRSAEQVRQWREEDEANGMPWNHSLKRELDK